MLLLSKVAVGFRFEWSNHLFGSLWAVSWLSPDELQREDSEGLERTAGSESPGLALRDASRASRWWRRVTEFAGEARRGRGWPVVEADCVGAGVCGRLACSRASVSDIVSVGLVIHVGASPWSWFCIFRVEFGINRASLIQPLWAERAGE
jgi:hypothetical protein